jgi:hypothetical protein
MGRLALEIQANEEARLWQEKKLRDEVVGLRHLLATLVRMYGQPMGITDMNIADTDGGLVLEYDPSMRITWLRYEPHKANE